MKTIEPVSIWDNGTIREAKILNANAVNVILGIQATFWYGLNSENQDLSIGVQLVSGYLTMTGDAYTQWQQDAYAWDWIAEQLNLTITGEYIPPAPSETTQAPEPQIESPAV